MSDKTGTLRRNLINSGAFDRLMTEPMADAESFRMPSSGAAKPTPYGDGEFKPIRDYSYEVTLPVEIEPSPVLDKMLAEMRERLLLTYVNYIIMSPEAYTGPAPVCADCARSARGLKCAICMSRDCF